VPHPSPSDHATHALLKSARHCLEVFRDSANDDEATNQINNILVWLEEENWAEWMTESDAQRWERLQSFDSTLDFTANARETRRVQRERVRIELEGRDVLQLLYARQGFVGRQRQ